MHIVVTKVKRARITRSASAIVHSVVLHGCLWCYYTDELSSGRSAGQSCVRSWVQSLKRRGHGSAILPLCDVTPPPI
jgi:hypothetical protein